MSTDSRSQVKNNKIFENASKITAIPRGLIMVGLSVYVLSIIGFGVSIVYLVWWILFPRKTPCIMCRVGRDGDKCVFCGETIGKPNDRSKSVKAALLNTFLIMLLSLLSLGILYSENRLMLATELVPDENTVDFIVKSKSQYKLNEIFTMGIDITKTKLPVNAVQVDIAFDKDKLEVLDVSTSDSFANVFLQEEIDNDVGFVRITGGLPNPGHIADKSNFCTIIFKAKKTGLAEVTFLDTSMVLANDGRGTNVLDSYKKTYYLISGDAVSKEESEAEQEVLNLSQQQEESDDTKLEFFDESVDAEVLGIKGEIRDGKHINTTSEVTEPGVITIKRNKPNDGNIIHLLYQANEKILEVWNEVTGARLPL